MSPDAQELLDLLADPTRVVWEAPSGGWHVTGKPGFVKIAAVMELIKAGRLVEHETDALETSYRRSPS
jgi:hypothetical protein